MQWKYLSFVVIDFFIFPVEAFHYFKFYENEAKYDKRNFKREVGTLHSMQKIR